jgi:hypothetical protein
VFIYVKTKKRIRLAGIKFQGKESSLFLGIPNVLPRENKFK